MDKHLYCRILLKQTRKEAKDEGVRLGKITAMKCWGYYFAEEKIDGRIKCLEVHDACCAYHARAEYISHKLDTILSDGR